MSAVLLAPVLVCAGVLGVSATAKLRAPMPAARALRTLGLPGSLGLVRGLATLELALAAAAVLSPGRVTAAGLVCAYTIFAVLALALARRRAACGCFGDDGSPASRGQALLSLACGAVCGLAVVWPVHGIGWVLGRSPTAATTLIAGLAACVYALVLAYTELPAAWAAWSGR